ncbi:MAG TPA: diguanylate cyclase [Gemmatimonadaceae bacterium]|jgi:two-component system cell cycle response regulator
MNSEARVLVVDDDEGVRRSLATALGDVGCVVREATDAASMRLLLTEWEPTLLLLDASLPDGEGTQLLQELKAGNGTRELPVILLASRLPDELTELALGLGAADVLRKPFRPRELVARVQAQLRLHALLRTTQAALLSAEDELNRVREDSENRRKLVDILHEVTGDLSSDEIYHILARRVARALSLSRCSVILARPGDKVGVVATAFDNPAIRNWEINLDAYPEIRAALEHGHPVLVEDLHTSPLYEDLRREWAANGTQVPIRSVIALPFTLGKVQAGVFFLRRMVNEPPLTNEDVEFADSVIKAAVAAIHRAQVIETTKADNARLEVLAHTDPLTQVLNRRALTVRLASELERARRYDSVLTLLMVDLDHFKNVNDTYGHLVGDEVLREVATLLQNEVRSVDVVARYGGEEFVVVLPETSLVGATTFAERIREHVAATPFAGSLVEPLHLTASIGVSSYPSATITTVDDLFARADEALYRAKADGRNRVCL